MEDQKGMANQEEWKEFYATHDSKDLTIAALMEANEMLGELLSRYRQSNALLRRINSDLRKLKNIQYNNDLEFQSMCQSGEHEYQDTPECKMPSQGIDGSEGLM